jgi:hypothetical protein
MRSAEQPFFTLVFVLMLWPQMAFSAQWPGKYRAFQNPPIDQIVFDDALRKKCTFHISWESYLNLEENSSGFAGYLIKRETLEIVIPTGVSKETTIANCGLVATANPLRVDRVRRWVVSALGGDSTSLRLSLTQGECTNDWCNGGPWHWPAGTPDLTLRLIDRSGQRVLLPNVGENALAYFVTDAEYAVMTQAAEQIVQKFVESLARRDYATAANFTSPTGHFSPEGLRGFTQYIESELGPLQGVMPLRSAIVTYPDSSDANDYAEVYTRFKGDKEQQGAQVFLLSGRGSQLRIYAIWGL